MTQPADSLEPELQRDMDACRVALGGGMGEPIDVGSLRQRVEHDFAAEQGFVARLRAMRTSHRVMLMLALVAAVVVANVALTPRVDFAAYPSGRMAFALALLASVTAGASWRLLRPLHAPPPSLWVSRLLLVAGVLLPCALSMIPMGHVGAAAGEGSQFVVGCGKCFGFGAAMGFPVLALAFFARRAHVDGAAVAALAGVAAGLTGVLALQVHCPITDPLHLLIGHALLVAALATATALWKR